MTEGQLADVSSSKNGTKLESCLSVFPQRTSAILTPKSYLKVTTMPGVTSTKTFSKVMFETEMIMNI
jgi:hypothetical protein